MTVIAQSVQIATAFLITGGDVFSTQEFFLKLKCSGIRWVSGSPHHLKSMKERGMGTMSHADTFDEFIGEPSRLQLERI